VAPALVYETRVVMNPAAANSASRAAPIGIQDDRQELVVMDAVLQERLAERTSRTDPSCEALRCRAVGTAQRASIR